MFVAHRNPNEVFLIFEDFITDAKRSGTVLKSKRQKK
jgi:hypothetical protein